MIKINEQTTTKVEYPNDMSNFKVGDKVVCLGKYHDTYPDFYPAKGTIGTIVEYEPCYGNQCYRVQWEKGSTARDDLWWAYNDDLVPAEDYRKIVITTDGKTTTARLYEGKAVVKSAEAKCHPDDAFNFAVGANLAYDRLMRADRACEVSKEEPIKLYCVKEPEISWVRESLTKGKIYEFDGHRIEYDDGSSAWFADFKAWKREDPDYAACLCPLVKRLAKEGEWVYIEHPLYTATEKDYKKGKIYKVIRRYAEGVVIHNDINIKTNLYDVEYLVLDGYKSEPEYYNGKVVCVKGGGFHTAGKIYEVKNGIVNDNTLKGNYNLGSPVKTIDELNSQSYPQFIEYKDEAQS